MIYGCHSDKAPTNKKDVYVISKGKYWLYNFTRKCQYDNKANDIKCNGCKHEHKDDKCLAE